MTAQAQTLIRRNVWTLPAGDTTLSDYAKAVAIMKARNASDPTSWIYQAAMHGTLAQQTKPLWNGCMHGTWFFLPWHRMFLYYFEQIVRAAVVQAGGSPAWTLPFWDYGAGGQQATLPLAFRNQTAGGNPNPLYVSQRAPGINTGMAIPSSIASAAHALSRPQFTGAAQFGGGITPAQQFSNQTGQLEQTPHNDLHVAVGGPSGWMSDPDQAAEDPIFWLHHSNIDRLWSVWNNAGHWDPSDQLWMTQKFSFFDAHGHQVQKSCGDVIRVLHQLGYNYETAPAQVVPSAAEAPAPEPVPAAAAAAAGAGNPGSGSEQEGELVGASDRPIELVGSPAEVSVQIDAQARSAAVADAAAARPRHIYLNVEDIEGERNPGVVYGIYLNLPADAPPEVAARHHASNVSFFGIERARNPRGDEQPHNLRVSVDITELAHELEAAGEWSDERVQVTFRPLGLVPEDQPELAHALPETPPSSEAPVRIGRVSVAYAP
ncbi:MAG: tyrosinase family protein [Solirubrobacterales bacterium]|nr:tyrosinase family protein [Solirubrobacterales bacterium]